MLGKVFFTEGEVCAHREGKKALREQIVFQRARGNNL